MDWRDWVLQLSQVDSAHQKHRDTIDALVEEYGYLPRGAWLAQNGYRSLYKHVLRYPQVVEGVPRAPSAMDRHKKTIQDIVDQFGYLPNHAFLMKNGYSALSAFVKDKPEIINEIPTESRKPRQLVRPRRSKEESKVEHRETINSLVSEFGYLPTQGWLQMNGYNSLAMFLYRSPDFVKGVPREKLFKEKVIEKFLEIAEWLVREHGGIPNVAWLISNGYGALHTHMRRYPELYRDYRRVKINKNIRKNKTREKHHKQAEEFTLQYGGIPSQRWLQVNGYFAFLQYVYRNPEEFSEYKRVYHGTQRTSKRCRVGLAR